MNFFVRNSRLLKASLIEFLVSLVHFFADGVAFCSLPYKAWLVVSHFYQLTFYILYNKRYFPSLPDCQGWLFPPKLSPSARLTLTQIPKIRQVGHFFTVPNFCRGSHLSYHLLSPHLAHFWPLVHTTTFGKKPTYVVPHVATNFPTSSTFDHHFSPFSRHFCGFSKCFSGRRQGSRDGDTHLRDIPKWRSLESGRFFR